MNQLYNSENKIAAELNTSLVKNIEVLEEMFRDCDDVVKKEFLFRRKDGAVSGYMIYIDGLTDGDMVQQHVIHPLQLRYRMAVETDIWSAFFYSEIDMADLREEPSFDKMVLAVMRGDTALMLDGYDRAIVISSKKLPVRSIEESETEAVMRGPRDSFNESLRMGTALIRRRIKDPKCKIVQHQFGERSRTDYAVVYMEDLVPDGLVDQIEEQLGRYRTDADL